MVKLIGLTAVAIFTAEALVMLFLESIGGQLSLPLRILLDSCLLLVCVFPTLYFLVFKEMSEQIRLRRLAEQTQNAWSQSLELMVEERTERLQRANEDLLIEVQERAKATMALRTALNDARKGKEQLRSILNAVLEALIVIDDQGCVLAVNQAAEVMFGASSYDSQGNSVKNFLRPWSQGPSDLDNFFRQELDNHSTFLISPESVDGDEQPVQMHFGAKLEWEGQSATLLMFYYRRDLPIDAPQKTRLT